VVVFRTKSLVFLDGSRGKASLEERLLHFKVLAFWAKCLGASVIPWRNSWMYPGAHL